MHKKSDVYKMYLENPTYVSASKLPSSGLFLAENCKNFLIQLYNKWLHIKKYRA